MISDPIKFNFGEENKNFSFRPQSLEFKENFKLRPFMTDKVRIEKFLKNKQIENDIINRNKRKNKNINLDTESTDNAGRNTMFSENIL